MKFIESLYIAVVYLVILLSPFAITVGTVATAIDYYSVSQSVAAAVFGSFVGGGATILAILILMIILGFIGLWLERKIK